MKNFLSLLFFCASITSVYSLETKIIHSIQNEIITNIDIKNEFKYLLALNNNLEKLDKEKILSISNESIIREKIKKIELLKNFKVLNIEDEYFDLLLSNIYSSLGLKSKEEFIVYLKKYNLILTDIKKR